MNNELVVSILTGHVLGTTEQTREAVSMAVVSLNKLTVIADLVEGTIDHFDLEDALDLLYQIKEVLDDD